MFAWSDTGFLIASNAIVGQKQLWNDKVDMFKCLHFNEYAILAPKRNNSEGLFGELEVYLDSRREWFRSLGGKSKVIGRVRAGMFGVEISACC